VNGMTEHADVRGGDGGPRAFTGASPRQCTLEPDTPQCGLTFRRLPNASRELLIPP
jgi:hypothetical protein